MELRIGEQLYKYENNNFEYEQLVTDIENHLKNTDAIIESFIIDGEEIFSELYEYVQNNLFNIRSLEVRIKPKTQFINELISSMDEYLVRAIPEIEKLSAKFYQGSTDNAWEEVIDLSEGMSWLNQALIFIVSNDSSYEEKVSQIHMEEALKTFEESLQEQNLTLIGDVLQYELIPLFQSIQKMIKSTSIEVKKNDIN